MGLSVETIRNRLRDLGHSYITNFYLEDSVRMVTYICRCGNTATTKLATVSQGFGCKSCRAGNISSALQQYDFTFMHAKFKEMGQELLKFTVTDQPLIYLCKCGNIQTIKSTRLAVLYRHEKCSKCRKPSNFGLGVNQSNRFTAEMRRWKLYVLQRDNYQCQKEDCKSDLDLHVHHILAYSLYPELMYKETNGITLCKRCHEFVHSKYGKQFSKEKLHYFLETPYGY